MKKETQLSVILTNVPGELSKLCDILKKENINILAMSIQNAKDSVKELYNMRVKTKSRVTMEESYRGILKENSDYSLIRLLLDNAEEGETVLRKANYLFDKGHVLVLKLENKPGMLGKVVGKIGDAHINIDYIYGSAMDGSQEAVFIVHIAEEDIDELKDSFRDF
jgi:hypothetical protein